jgi:hypothetical protein
MIRILMTLTLLLGAAPAHAHEADDLDEPAPELESMKWLFGSWKCEGTLIPVKGVGKPYVSTDHITYVTALSGFAVSVHFAMEPTVKMPMKTPLEFQAIFTYDRFKKVWVLFNLNNRGSNGFFTSPGWQGQKLVWTGKMEGLPNPERREIIVKSTVNEFRFLRERKEDGKWFQNGEQVCVRQW